MRAEITKIWTDLECVSRERRGQTGFVWCVELFDDAGKSMPFGRYDSREKAVERLARVKCETITDITGHTSLAYAPEDHIGDEERWVVFVPQCGPSDNPDSYWYTVHDVGHPFSSEAKALAFAKTAKSNVTSAARVQHQTLERLGWTHHEPVTEIECIYEAVPKPSTGSDSARWPGKSPTRNSAASSDDRGRSMDQPSSNP